MAALGKAYIEVRADLAAFPADLRAKLEAAFKEATAGIKFEDLDKKVAEEGEAAADRMADDFEQEAQKRMKPAGEKAGRSFFSGLLGIFPLLMSSFLPTLIALGVEVGAYLAPAVVALAAAIPAAASIAVSSLAAVAIATHGVGDAIKAAFSDDPAKLAAAMAKLAPAAREFVGEVQKARPVLHALQQDIQQAFFVQLEGSITRLTTSLLPTLRTGLHNVAGDVGLIGRNIVSSIISHRADIESVFLGVHYSLQNLVPVMGKFVGSFITLAAVAGPFVDTLVGKLADGMSRFADAIERAANSGGLANFFETALGILRSLRGMLSQVWRVISEIVSALGETGSEGLGFLTLLFKEIGDFLATPAGHGALVAIFHLLNVVLQALATIVQPLLGPLGEFTGALADKLAQAVIQLTPGLTKLVDAFADMLPHLIPLLPALVVIATAIGQILEFLGEHPKAVQAAVTALAAYKTALMVIAAWEAIVDAENPLTWAILAVAAIVAGAILIYKNWDKVKSLFSGLWDVIKQGAGAVGGFFSDLGSKVAGFFSGVGQFFVNLPGQIASWLASLPGTLVGIFKGALDAVAQAIGFWIGVWLGLLITLPGKIANALLSLPGVLWGIWKTATDTVTNLALSWLSQLGGFFVSLPGKIWGWLSNLPGALHSIFTQAMNNARDAVSRGADSIVGFARGLPGRLRGFFSNAGHDILSGLKDGINGVIRSFNRGIDHAAGPLHVVLPHIPLLANGALITSPTLAVIGEAGPEVAIPLNNANRARQLANESGLTRLLNRGAPPVNVNVTAVLGTGELLTVLDQRVDLKMGDEAESLSTGQRTGGF